jgi:signal transduction histidine kinase
MEGRADLMGPGDTARNIFDWPAADSQCEMFDSQPGITEPLDNVIFFETLAAPSGELTPALHPAQRDRFLETSLRAQEQERLRLGRELHDSTGQLVLALRLGIAHLKRVQGTAAEDSLLSEIDEVARQLDREIRSFAFLQYPAEIGSGGLVEALQYLTRGFQARTGLKVRFSNSSHGLIEDESSATALLRVAQEALMNVHRHAHAVHVRMSLAIKNGMLRLIVRDDGVGIPHDAPQGVGLQGMRHRVERLGGSFMVRRLAHGTELVASLPA